MLRISVSRGNQGEVKNVSISWPDLIVKLSTPHKDTISWKEYEELDKTAQTKRKNVGYFVSGQFDGGKRQAKNIHKHCILALDIDKPTAELFDELIDPLIGYLAEYEYFVYTTRSHRAGSPKLRIVVPLLSEIGNDAFSAATRLMAHYLDPLMKAVDPVSFRPAQIMYNPSICADGDFKCYHHRGRILDAETDILAGFEGDWHDYRQLPRGERDSARPSAAKAEHPSQKRGIVGAYCRARDIFAQLDLMRDVYEPAEEGPTPLRWSYLHGSSRNGAIVFPEDLRFQSFHSTDPAFGKNLTAFDMQRIHRFGELDPAHDSFDEIDPRELPSYKALVKAIRDEPEYEDVRHEVAAMNYDQDAMADDAEFNTDLETDEAETSTPAVGAIVAEAIEDVAEVTSTGEIKAKKPEVNILDLLDMTEKGAVRKTLYNYQLILSHDPRFKGCFRYNELLRKVVVVRRVSSKALDLHSPRIVNKANGDRMTDDVRTTVRTIMSAPNRPVGDSKSPVGWGVQVGDEEMARAIENVAVKNSFHPIKKYLAALKWDGVPRVARMFHRYWKTPDDIYHAEVARIMTVAAVCRVFEPGHKFDNMVIAEGLTGARKSSAVKVMAVYPEWFAEFMADLNNQQRVTENIEGRWFVEWPELAGMDTGDVNRLKAILSSGNLIVRDAYGRESGDHPLQGVFMGTTNDQEYLKDPTGNRRYLPIRVPDDEIVDVVGLAADIHQIWAEALQMYLHMRRVQPKDVLPLFLCGEAAVVAKIKQGQRMVKGRELYWKAEIEEFLETKTSETIAAGDDMGAFDDGEDVSSDRKLLPHRVCVRSIVKYALRMDYRVMRKLELDLVAKTLDQIEDLERASHFQRFRGFGKLTAWNVKPL